MAKNDASRLKPAANGTGVDPNKLTTRDAAQQLGMSVGYLNVMRHFGEGPKFHKDAKTHRVTYKTADVDAWEAKRKDKVQKKADRKAAKLAAKDARTTARKTGAGAKAKVAVGDKANKSPAKVKATTKTAAKTGAKPKVKSASAITPPKGKPKTVKAKAPKAAKPDPVDGLVPPIAPAPAAPKVDAAATAGGGDFG